MTDSVALPLHRFIPKRYRPGNLGTWSGHLPFAYDLISELRPALVVELGTHYGESYFGFCQAVADSGVACRCVAVDTWQGDEHAGVYGEDVFCEVDKYNAENYESFSTLMRSTFDQANSEFDPDSIDLLHIDGLHTYAAVKHDFETWWPKVKPGGVVLFHDIQVRHADFEVWRFWEELRRENVHFEFAHWWGLGVLVKPGATGPQAPFLKMLTEADQAKAEQIRRQYNDAADLLDFRERKPKTAQAAADADRPYLQVFPSLLNQGFVERESIVANIEGGVWQQHVVELPQGAPGGAIRIDPVNHPAWVEISSLIVRDGANETLLDLNSAQIRQLPCLHQLMSVVSTDAPRFFSWGKDPQLRIDLPPGTRERAPLILEFTMRIGFGLEEVREAILAQATPPDSTALNAELQRVASANSNLETRIGALQNQIRLLQTERAASAAERAHLQTQVDNWHAHTTELRATLTREESHQTSLKWDLTILRTNVLDRQHSIKQLTDSLEAAVLREEHLRNELALRDKAIQNLQRLSAVHQARVEGLTESLSWRITAPLRAVAGSFLKE